MVILMNKSHFKEWYVILACWKSNLSLIKIISGNLGENTWKTVFFTSDH